MLSPYQGQTDSSCCPAGVYSYVMDETPKPSEEPWFRLLFYKEDIQRLEALLREIIATNGLEGCVMSDLWGAPIVFHGKVPMNLGESIADQVRYGKVPNA